MELLPQQLVGGLALGCIYSLIAIGFTMLIKAVDLVNFAQGEVMMLGAMVGYSLVSGLKLPFLLVFGIVIVVTAVFGFLLDRGVIRPMRLRAAPITNIIVATVGLSILFKSLAILQWGADPLKYPEVFGMQPLPIPGVRILPETAWVFGLTSVLLVALQLFFQRTDLGIGMRAAAYDSETAKLMGINVDRAVAYTFGIASALAGAAGVLFAPIFYATYDMGDIAIKAFAAACLGGLGNLPGALIGGLLLGVIEVLGAFFISSAYRDAIAYGVIILVLLFWPSGLLGRAERVA